MSDPKDEMRLNPPIRAEMPKFQYQQLDSRTYSVSAPDNSKQEKTERQFESLSNLCL